MRLSFLLLLSGGLCLSCAKTHDAQEPEGLIKGVNTLTKLGGGTNGDWDYCGSADCITGEGDCDGDGQCGGAADLLCGDNNGSRFGLTSSHDVCWPSHCESGIQDGDETGVDLGGSCDLCAGANGDFSFCSPACPCDSGEGDCDNDTHCSNGVCGDNNGARFGFSSGIDVCWPATCENGIKDGDEVSIDFGGSCGGSCFAGAAGGFSYCSDDCPCASGGGDCDSDNQCSAALICGDNNGARFNFPSSVDVCWPSTCQNASRDKGETGVDIGGPCGMGPWLVINEFEYDDLSGDDREFVEIYNAGLYTLNLTDVVLEAINSSGAVYETYNLSEVGDGLRSGEYLVVGSSSITAGLPEGVGSITIGTYVFNNVTAGFKLRQGDDLLDTVSYEGVIAGITEGTAAQTDSNSAEGNSRCQNGSDSDDGSTDFALRAVTPGAANDCP